MGRAAGTCTEQSSHDSRTKGCKGTPRGHLTPHHRTPTQVFDSTNVLVTVRSAWHGVDLPRVVHHGAVVTPGGTRTRGVDSDTSRHRIQNVRQTPRPATLAGRLHSPLGPRLPHRPCQHREHCTTYSSPMWSLSKSRCRGLAVWGQLSHASGVPSWSVSAPPEQVLRGLPPCPLAWADRTRPDSLKVRNTSG